MQRKGAIEFCKQSVVLAGHWF